jgi:hypothetical protein
MKTRTLPSFVFDCLILLGSHYGISQSIARNYNNLSYASFFPVVSFGFGYSFNVGK